MTLKPSVALSITRHRVFRSVSRAVDLDAELHFGAVEIKDQPTEGMLSTKLGVRYLPPSQGVPELGLCRRWSLSLVASPTSYVARGIVSGYLVVAFCCF